MKNARRFRDYLKKQLKDPAVRKSYEDETAKILSDKRLMAALRQGIKEIKEGKGIPWEHVKRKSFVSSRGFLKGMKASDIREKRDRI